MSTDLPTLPHAQHLFGLLLHRDWIIRSKCVYLTTSLAVLSGCDRIHNAGWLPSSCYIRLYQNRPVLAAGGWIHLEFVAGWATLDSLGVKTT